jgi:hypothetical protein
MGPKEYRDISAQEYAIRTELARSWSDAVHGIVRLVHSTAGYEVAGSAARFTNEYFAVRFQLGNATHGRRFKSEAEARETYARLTENKKERE